MVNGFVRPGDNPDLTKERKSSSFNVVELSEFIHGGKEVLARRREILEYVESKPEFKQEIPIEFLSREQRYEQQAKNAVAMTEYATEAIDGSDFFGEGMYYQQLIMGRDLHALSLHYVMFLPTIQNQTTEEQLDKWLGLVITRGIAGTYAQTELGHGTNLSQLETTATYDPKKEEFVIHSPTISAAKWWPGALGKSSTHAIVMAQLITAGKRYGPHPFIVQIRDLESHQPLKGITVGDIGPKLGINGSDNGFLLFNNYRIPRENMLMRNAKVTKEGEYIHPKHQKLGYGSMVFVRSIMIRDQSLQLAAASIIATRYSAVRRQGEPVPGKGEVQILDYRTQQLRIFPQIAKTLAFLFAASEVRDLYIKVTEQLSDGNVELLPELHSLSSGLKSVISWEVAQGIEQCRLSCGGHGYSQASGFPEIYAYAVGGCTYEGENIVMLLQVARQLMKSVSKLRDKTAKLAEIDEYLGATRVQKSRFNGLHELKPDILIKDFEEVARKHVFGAWSRFETLKRTLPEHNAFNSISIDLCRASRWHVKAYLVKNFFTYIGRFRGSSRIREIMMDLASLYALDQISAGLAHFSRDGYYSQGQGDQVKVSIETLLDRLRPEAVSIVDSFDFSDRELHSVLGRRDGNVYENLLKWAQQSQLNQHDVLDAYHKYLGPMMKEGRAKL